MAGNRVDQLEETVQELEATVSGLTDELIEMKERLRVLEAEVDPDLDAGLVEGQLVTGVEETEADDETVEKAIEVAAGGEGADEDKSDEGQGTTEAGPEESDDIIVA